MECLIIGSNGGGGVVLNGVEFGNEFGEFVKCMIVWSLQVEDVLSDFIVIVVFIWVFV